MKNNSKLSLKTKKILAGIGIAFGTVATFLVSFVLSFSLIVNPINLFTFNDSDTIKENEELKEKVQTLNDEIEHLSASVDKYKASAQSVSIPVVTTPSNEEPQQTPDSSDSDLQSSTSSSAQNQNGSTETSEEIKGESETKFSPETVTGTAEKTPEDIEEPITVIDISE